jgi:hypothetical protein
MRPCFARERRAGVPATRIEPKRADNPCGISNDGGRSLSPIIRGFSPDAPAQQGLRVEWLRGDNRMTTGTSRTARSDSDLPRSHTRNNPHRIIRWVGEPHSTLVLAYYLPRSLGPVRIARYHKIWGRAPYGTEGAQMSRICPASGSKVVHIPGSTSVTRHGRFQPVDRPVSSGRPFSRKRVICLT